MLTDNISRNENGELYFGNHNVKELADKYKTPLYLMDEQRIRQNCRMYIDAFKKCFGEKGKVLFASKSASFVKIYQITDSEGLGADVVSPGELYTALRAGVSADKLYFHGNAKTDEDIQYGIDSRIGHFVVDNYDELYIVNEKAAKAGIKQKILLRVTPGIDCHTYEAISTGKVDSKFGIAIETGQAIDFVKVALSLENIEVCGLHCHVGSMVFEEDVYQRTSDIMLGFMNEIRAKFGVALEELNLGGGYGVKYIEESNNAYIGDKIEELAAYIKDVCSKLDFPMPTIIMEPGRSIVADAGMTLYTVSSIKRITEYKNYVAIDGGMTDNPRFALYEAQYTVLNYKDSDTQEKFDLVGRCCESGDIIQPNVMLNSDIKRGDLVAVCTTGAYNYSMASNYNRIPRPPIIMLTPDSEYIAVKRETFEDLVHNEI